MSLATLERSQAEASKRMDFPYYPEFVAAHAPHVHYLGNLVVRGMEMPVMRGHSGDEDDINKGGTRLALASSMAEAQATVLELAAEMFDKPFLRGINNPNRRRIVPYHNQFPLGKKKIVGGKAFVLADPRIARKDPSIIGEIMYAFGQKMDQAGLAGYDKDVPATDNNTNGWADPYALAQRDLNENNRFWQASITGKSAEKGNGGVEPRRWATSWGLFESLNAYLEMRDPDDSKIRDVTVPGFGNVGAWTAHFVNSNERTRVKATSDASGTLTTSHPMGLPITRQMVEEIGDNKNFKGDKMLALAAAIEKEFPELIGQLKLTDDPDDIFSMETDYMIACSPFNDAINENNMRDVQVKKALIEGTNGLTTPVAHQYLTYELGVDTLPDVAANGAGIDGSIQEYDINMAMALGLVKETPENAVLEEALSHSARTLIKNILRMQELLQTKDMRVATAGVTMGQFALSFGLSLDQEFQNALELAA